MTLIYRLYQLLIALPLLMVGTLLCSIVTVLAGRRWRNARWLYHAQQLWARSFCYLMFIKVSVRGLEHIQPGQSYVFVSNHQSFYDIFVIYGWLPVIFKWLMKKEIGRIPFVAQACQAAGHICVDRTHARAAQESLQKVEAELQNGVSTVIFPEGTRTSDGAIQPFKRGAFRIAQDLQLPIIPISISGAYEVMNRHAFFVTRHPISLYIGQALSADEDIEVVRQHVIEGVSKCTK